MIKSVVIHPNPARPDVRLEVERSPGGHARLSFRVGAENRADFELNPDDARVLATVLWPDGVR